MFSFSKNAKWFSKVTLLICILLCEGLSCAASSSALETVGHSCFCQPEVQNGICQAGEGAPLADTWAGAGGGGPPTPRWIAEVTRVPTTRNGNPNTLTHRIMVLESPRKIQRSQAWMECFYSQRKQQTKISSNSVCWFPVAGGPLSSQYRAIGLHASGPLVPQPVCVSRSVVSDSLRPHEL